MKDIKTKLMTEGLICHLKQLVNVVIKIRISNVHLKKERKEKRNLRSIFL